MVERRTYLQSPSCNIPIDTPQLSVLSSTQGAEFRELLHGARVWQVFQTGTIYHVPSSGARVDRRSDTIFGDKVFVPYRVSSVRGLPR